MRRRCAQLALLACASRAFIAPRTPLAPAVAPALVAAPAAAETLEILGKSSAEIFPVSNVSLLTWQLDRNGSFPFISC